MQFRLSTCVFSTILAIVSGNYPAYANYKPCARLKNTINFQKAICLDDGSGGFEEASRKNCEGPFKATCPEFNEATCMWANNISFPNSSAAPSPVPVCRLKYFATDYTWLEIYYTLQYGKDVPVYDIVEIHRKNKNHYSFGDRDQKDWPDSVTDPNGERGLTWVVVSNLTKPLNISGPSSDFCTNDNDTRCNQILQYVTINYPTGFNESRAPYKSNVEIDNNATLRYTFSSACRDVWVDAQKSRACQVLYWYNSTFHNPLGGKYDAQKTLIFEFLEVQVYYRNASNPVFRYAYWSDVEKPEFRYEIFNAQNTPNVTNTSSEVQIMGIKRKGIMGLS